MTRSARLAAEMFVLAATWRRLDEAEQCVRLGRGSVHQAAYAYRVNEAALRQRFDINRLLAFATNDPF